MKIIVNYSHPFITCRTTVTRTIYKLNTCTNIASCNMSSKQLCNNNIASSCILTCKQPLIDCTCLCSTELILFVTCLESYTCTYMCILINKQPHIISIIVLHIIIIASAQMRFSVKLPINLYTCTMDPPR